MIEWLKSWTNQIVVAIIIAVLLELILPNGKNKKYIKMMINLYVLFVVLNPIILKWTNNNDLSIQKELKNQLYDSFESETASDITHTNNMIEHTYEKSLQEDIKKKLENKGYKVTRMSIDIKKDHGENYGAIKQLTLTITKNEIQVQDSSNILIETVEPVSTTNQSNKRQYQIKNTEVKQLKKYLSEEYQIKENNIEITNEKE